MPIYRKIPFRLCEKRYKEVMLLIRHEINSEITFGGKKEGPSMESEYLLQFTCHHGCVRRKQISKRTQRRISSNGLYVSRNLHKITFCSRKNTGKLPMRSIQTPGPTPKWRFIRMDLDVLKTPNAMRCVRYKSTKATHNNCKTRVCSTNTISLLRYKMNFPFSISIPQIINFNRLGIQFTYGAVTRLRR